MLIIFLISLLFLDIWVTYKAIRTQYHPEYIFIFDDWIERFIHRAIIYQWSLVLNYVIIYFQAHQKNSSSQWLFLDFDLIINIIISSSIFFYIIIFNISQRFILSSSKTINNYISNIYQNWNRSKYIKEIIDVNCNYCYIYNTCFKNIHKVI